MLVPWLGTSRYRKIHPFEPDKVPKDSCIYSRYVGTYLITYCPFEVAILPYQIIKHIYDRRCGPSGMSISSLWSISVSISVSILFQFQVSISISIPISTSMRSGLIAVYGRRCWPHVSLRLHQIAWQVSRGKSFLGLIAMRLFHYFGSTEIPRLP